MTPTPKAEPALLKIVALRKMTNRTGTDTARAQRFVMHALGTADQIWVCEQLEKYSAAHSTADNEVGGAL